MRVLVLSSVFPNPKQPAFGIFVQERMRRVAQHCELEVVAPVPWFPLNGLIRGPRWTGLPGVEERAGLRVHHPRFFCIPRYAKWLDGLLYAISLLPFLARLRRAFRFELIDAHFAYPDGLAAVLLGAVFRCPVVITLRGTIVRLKTHHMIRPQIRFALGRAAHVLTVSESLKNVALQFGVSDDRICVVPNGVDTNTFRPRPKHQARATLGLPQGRTVLLSVGSLSPRKGHHRIVESLPRVISIHPELLCVIVGGPGPEGDITPLLHRRIDQLRLWNHVFLAGPQPHDQVAAWMAAADVLCLASANEGRANVLLEALACGLPVVTTDVGGSREVVGPDDGILVPLASGAQLELAVLHALDAQWDRSAIAARASARTWDHTAATVMQVFHSALAVESMPAPSSTSLRAF